MVMFALVLLLCVAVRGETLTKDPGTCGSIEVTGNATLLHNYRHCITIEGNLRIHLIQNLTEDWSLIGLPNLTQVTGYVLLYRLTHIHTLTHLLPRLAVIRGRTLFHGHSLVIYGNIYLSKLDWNLRAILRGSVRIESNWSLCPGPLTKWIHLTGNHSNYIEDNYKLCIYLPDAKRINTTTTTTTTTITTTTTNITDTNNNTTSALCDNGQVCYLDCNSECVGGCYSPGNSSSCVACRHFKYGGQCVGVCPHDPPTLQYLDYLCIPEATCRDHQHTIQSNNTCIPCHGTCNEMCPGQTISSRDLGRALRHCKVVKGSINITIAGGRNVIKELEENLGQVERVSGYIRIHDSDTLFSLNFLSSLREIGGEELVDGKYALYVLENENLQELWQKDHQPPLHIKRGNILALYNPRLCHDLITQLARRNGKNVTSEENPTPCLGPELPMSVKPGRTPTSVSVWWQHIFTGHDDRVIIGYYIFYREAPQPVTIFQNRDACNDERLWERWFQEYEQVFENSRENWTATLDNLKPYTNYSLYVSVHGIDAEKVTTRSAIQRVTTGVAVSSPVQEVHVRRNSSSSLHVTWSPPLVSNGPNLYYLLEVREERYQTYDTSQACVSPTKNRHRTTGKETGTGVMGGDEGRDNEGRHDGEGDSEEGGGVGGDDGGGGSMKDASEGGEEEEGKGRIDDEGGVRRGRVGDDICCPCNNTHTEEKPNPNKKKKEEKENQLVSSTFTPSSSSSTSASTSTSTFSFGYVVQAKTTSMQIIFNPQIHRSEETVAVTESGSNLFDEGTDGRTKSGNLFDEGIDDRTKSGNLFEEGTDGRTKSGYDFDEGTDGRTKSGYDFEEGIEGKNEKWETYLTKELTAERKVETYLKKGTDGRTKSGNLFEEGIDGRTKSGNLFDEGIDSRTKSGYEFEEGVEGRTREDAREHRRLTDCDVPHHHHHLLP
ncbi:hypothetical protein Pcinc_019436 [Petrolisthes cinctipes]|uniref:Receptor protein-tyrosine kinase n=1 Tax=Petrolisthes cinctipes TaxID=88211 RepID=A0AAE1KL69_PETCI|nr:hypothetical protein Pcinc_019436 [Petrolisthes cinctipes]